MKRIILTEDQRIQLEAKKIILKQKRLRRDLRAYYAAKKAKRGRCKCGRRFTFHHAETCGFPGHCSLRCYNGKFTNTTVVRPKTAKEWKQLRRQEILQRKKAGTFDFFKSSDWKRLRFQILRKYGFKCMACGVGKDRSVMHVDHIKPRSKYPHLELDPENLQVLCEDCNIGKSNHYEDDLRPKLELVPDEEVDFLTDAAKNYL